ncbi:MAG: hypothetical protein IK143_04675 [Bacteroidales bacterium]|nr:hypothetical protein [Bacteroidales bacterium]
MDTKNLTYEQPSSAIVLIEVEESVLGEKKSGGSSGSGSGTEPIIDDGTSHGWG